MIEEKFSDEERQVLLVLSMDAVVREPLPMLEAVLRKLSGTETVLVAHRAYPSDAYHVVSDDRRMEVPDAGC